MKETENPEPGHEAGMDVSSLRRSATGLTLEGAGLAEDPIKQFEIWFRLVSAILRYGHT